MAKKNKIFTGKQRVFKAPVTVGKESITITLPKKVIEYLNLTEREVFWAPVSGVLQISGQLPHMVIPMITITEHEFVPQSARVVDAE